jgi:hydrogenase large subunit
MSPRWFDGTDHLALDTGGGPIARLWSTALSGLVNTDHIKATGSSVQIFLPRTALKPEMTLEWKVPQWSNTLERDRARTYFQAYAAASALDFIEKALADVRAGKTKTWEPFEVPDEGIGCGFTEAGRAVAPHGIRQDRQLPLSLPTPWNANPRRVRHPGPYEDAVMNTPIFEENTLENSRDRHHARRPQLDPCLPCGVHMFLGKGKTPSGCTPDPGSRLDLAT